MFGGQLDISAHKEELFLETPQLLIEQGNGGSTRVYLAVCQAQYLSEPFHIPSPYGSAKYEDEIDDSENY